MISNRTVAIRAQDEAIRRKGLELLHTTRRRERAKAIKAGSLPPCTTKELVTRGEEVLRQSRAKAADRPQPKARRRPRIVTIALPGERFL
jgi:hypothetical protein